MKRVERPVVREGYDLWSETYDSTPNPLVSLDRRMRSPCSIRNRTSASSTRLAERASISGRSRQPAGGPSGSISRVPCHVARRQVPGVPLVHGDLHDEWPFLSEDFEAILCTWSANTSAVRSSSATLLRP